MPIFGHLKSSNNAEEASHKDSRRDRDGLAGTGVLRGGRAAGAGRPRRGRTGGSGAGAGSGAAGGCRSRRGRSSGSGAGAAGAGLAGASEDIAAELGALADGAIEGGRVGLVPRVRLDLVGLPSGGERARYAEGTGVGL